MAKFAVLDRSLTCVGGHPYELALRILHAAERLGYEPVLAAHRHFTQRQSLPGHWRVLSVFADESRDLLAGYPFDIHGHALESPAGTACEGLPERVVRRWPQALSQWWRGRRCRRSIERFAAACAAIHSSLDLCEGDHVFLPTTSLFELLGLARFLAMRDEVSDVTWHGLFHRGLLQGREPEYESQADAERRFRRQFEYLVECISPGRLRLYGTSRKLADQFNRLSPLEFGVLPYPVDARVFQNDERDGTPRPLRLLCGGFLRREKGKGLARHFVERLWEQELVTGQVQLVVQTNRRQARRIISRRTAVPVVFRTSLQRADATPIVWLRHPLAASAYTELIRQSHMALFLHDGRAYYTQCSGVLVEMLAAGVPVLVPAGSWLADQVSDAIYEHLDGLRASDSVVGISRPHAGVRHGSLVASAAGVDLGCGPASAGVACDIPVPSAAQAALISFTWNPHTPPGTYVRVAVQSGGSGPPDRAASTTAILGPRSVRQPVSTLVPLDTQTRRITLSFSNAYDTGGVSVTRVEIHWLGAPAGGASSYPAGRVGLIFSDVDQLPFLVRNMREHYGHYLDSAREYAVTWSDEHDAQRVIQRVLSGQPTSQRAVA